MSNGIERSGAIIPHTNGVEDILRIAQVRFGDPQGSRESGAGKDSAALFATPPDFMATENDDGLFIDSFMLYEDDLYTPDRVLVTSERRFDYGD